MSKQGCYINKITTPNKDFGLYVGGSASLSPKPFPITRPARGKLNSIPYVVPKPGIPFGVGRRITQHLHDDTRLKKLSTHYKFMEERGNKYDFRLLAVFEEEVRSGAVWLLEAFFVEQFETIWQPKTRSSASPSHIGLNRISPLLTVYNSPPRVQQAR